MQRELLERLLVALLLAQKRGGLEWTTNVNELQDHLPGALLTSVGPVAVEISYMISKEGHKQPWCLGLEFPGRLPTEVCWNFDHYAEFQGQLDELFAQAQAQISPRKRALLEAFLVKLDNLQGRDK